jgi:hypothetical protein
LSGTAVSLVGGEPGPMSHRTRPLDYIKDGRVPSWAPEQPNTKRRAPYLIPQIGRRVRHLGSPNLYKSCVPCPVHTFEFSVSRSRSSPHNLLPWVPPWQVCRSKTPTAGAPGRGDHHHRENLKDILTKFDPIGVLRLSFVLRRFHVAWCHTQFEVAESDF